MATASIAAGKNNSPMADNRGEKPTVGRDAVASYVTTMLEELVPLAKQSDLPVVAYLLNMALMEVKMEVAQSTNATEPSRS